MSGVAGYLVRRGVVGAGLLVLLALVSFVLFYAVPTEPAAFLLDMRHASPEDIAEAIRFLLRTSRNCIVPEVQFVRPGDSEI